MKPNGAPKCDHCGGNHQPEYSCGAAGKKIDKEHSLYSDEYVRSLKAERDALLKRAEEAEGRCTEADKEIAQLEGRLCRAINEVKRYVLWLEENGHHVGGSSDTEDPHYKCYACERVEESHREVNKCSPCSHAADLAAIRERNEKLEKVAEAAKKIRIAVMHAHWECKQAGIMLGPYNRHSDNCEECGAWRDFEAALRELEVKP